MDGNKHKCLAGLCAIALFGQISIAQVPCKYDVTIIAAPVECGLGTVNTFGLGINENGAVVGRYQCPLWEHTEAFIWTAENGFVTLDRPEGVYSASAVDINDNGVICGTAWLFDLGQRGFVYDSGKWTILDPVVPDGGWSNANAINNAGVLVGQRSITENLNPLNAYFWTVKDGFTDLGVMKGPSSAAMNINDNGDICGWTGSGIFALDTSGFLWSNSELEVFGEVPGGLQSTAFAINSGVAVVGSGAIPEDGYQFGIPRAFLWQEGKFTMLGTLPDHLISRAQDIRNNSQQIVGRSWNVDDTPSIAHGFIWEEGQMHNLNDFISGEYGVLIEGATGISINGEIVANGDDVTGEIVAFILTPSNTPLGDLDGDCIVGICDLSILLKNWGSCPHDGTCQSDLDQNGITSTSDLLILFTNWGWR